MLTPSVALCRPTFQTYYELSEEVKLENGTSGKQRFLFTVLRYSGALEHWIFNFFKKIFRGKKKYVCETSKEKTREN